MKALFLGACLLSQAVFADLDLSFRSPEDALVLVNGVKVEGGQDRSITIADTELEEHRRYTIRAAYNEKGHRVVTEDSFQFRPEVRSTEIDVQRQLKPICEMKFEAPEPCLFAVDEWLNSLAGILSPAKADFARRVAKIASKLQTADTISGIQDREEHVTYARLFIFTSMRSLLENTLSAVVQTQILPQFLEVQAEAGALYWVQGLDTFKATPRVLRLSLGILQAASQGLQHYDGQNDSFGDLQVALGTAMAAADPVSKLRDVEAALAAEEVTITELFASPFSTGLAQVLMEQRAFLKRVNP